MAFTAYSAKNAKIRYGVGIATLTAKKWTATPKVDKIDITNFEAAGFFKPLAGIHYLDITIELDIDGQSNPYDAGFSEGATVASVKLYLNDTTGPYWDVPLFFVESTTSPHDVKQSGQMTITGCASGTFTDPTGVIA